MTTVSERVLEALLETATDHAIIAMDLDGLVTLWSEGARAMLGWTAAQMAGQPASLCFTEEDRAAGVPQAELQAVLLHGRRSDERWHLRQDGTRFWASGEMLALRDTAGQVHGLMKILRDRTTRHLAEARQHADAEFLRSVLAASGDCIKVLDMDGRVQFVNDGGMALLEVSDFDQMRGCPWPDFWPGDGHGQAMRALAVARSGGTATFQNAANTFAGNSRYWDVQVTPILGADGTPEKLLAVSRDITSGRAGELALREAQGLNALILDSAQDCITVLDHEACTLFISPGGLAALEIEDASAVLGVSWLCVWQGEHTARARAAVQAACEGQTGRFQAACLTQTGRMKWWDVVISPLPGPAGTPGRLVSIGRDITEARLAQNQLLVSEERLQLALGASDMVGIWDADLAAGTIYADANFARVHGMDVAQAAAGAPLTDVFCNMHPDDAPVLRDQLHRMMDGADTLHVEHRLKQPDGTDRWVLAQGRLVRDAAGLPIRLPGAIVDVTERRESEQRQRLLMEEMAHRVKNTLAVVQSIARQTLRDDADIATAREALSARLVSLGAAHDVLMQGSWSRTSLGPLVDSAARLHAPGPGRWTVAGPEVVLGPRAALAFAMVLHELGTNAVKYGALSVAGGTVDVCWRVMDAPGQETLHFAWSERNGPQVAPPTRRGFGTRLIERSLVSELQGTVAYAYTPDGVTLTLDAPIQALEQDVFS